MRVRWAAVTICLLLLSAAPASADWAPHGKRERQVLAAAVDQVDGWRSANPSSVAGEVPGCWGFAPGKWGCIARLWFTDGSVCTRYTVEREIFVDHAGRFVRRGRAMAVSDGGDRAVPCARPTDLSYGAERGRGRAE